MKKIPRFIAPLTFREVMAATVQEQLLDRRGDPLRAFSERFASYIGVKYAVPAPSARVALGAILHAMEFPKDGEVILPSLTFHAIPAMLLHLGLRPRFVDIRPSTYCIDPEKIERAITPSTVAIMPVHLYGRACEMETIGRIAERHGLPVIEDCAQSCGGFFQGRRLGSLGRGAVFSFGPTKNLSALWAGMAVTDCADLAERMGTWIGELPRIGRSDLTSRLAFAMAMRVVTTPRLWRTFMAPSLELLARVGIDPIEALTRESWSEETGVDRDAKLMPRPLQGRIAIHQLETLDVANRRRIRNGERLLARLSDIAGIETSASAPAGENVFMSFVVQVEAREPFRRGMLARGVDTAVGNMSVGPLLSGLEGTGDTASAAYVQDHMVHLPVYPEMDDADVDRVAAAVATVLSVGSP